MQSGSADDFEANPDRAKKNEAENRSKFYDSLSDEGISAFGSQRTYQFMCYAYIEKNRNNRDDN